MSLEVFKERLSRKLNLDLELKVNENHSTMLRLLNRNWRKARLSVHRMFLEAPDPVISAIAHYVKGSRRGWKEQSLILRGYIQTHLSTLDYSHTLRPGSCIAQGEMYDLQALYDTLNETYFQKALNLSISWFGEKKCRNRSRIVYGQYLDTKKLIKIHRLLDDPFFPPYFVSFIIYHEMVHSVVPGFIDEKGYYRIHGPLFKAQERAFEEYERAIDWERSNKHLIFQPKKMKYGRS